MKNFNSNSWLFLICTFIGYCSFIFYLIQQKAAGHALIENISGFNIKLLLLSLLPTYLQHFKNKKQDMVEASQIISIYEEKKLQEQQQLKLQASKTLRIKNYLLNIYLAYLMAALMMSIILLLDQ